MRKGAAAGSPRGAGVYRRAQPTTTASRIAYSVSLLDIFPTLVDLASMGRPQPALADPIDGHSLVPMLYLGNKGALSSAVVFFFFWGGGRCGDHASLRLIRLSSTADGRSGGLRRLVAWPDTVLAEYNAEGALQPLLMIRRGQYKYIHSAVDGPQLFNLTNDPEELANLARVPEHASRLQGVPACAHERPLGVGLTLRRPMTTLCLWPYPVVLGEWGPGIGNAHDALPARSLSRGGPRPVGCGRAQQRGAREPATAVARAAGGPPHAGGARDASLGGQ